MLLKTDQSPGVPLQIRRVLVAAEIIGLGAGQFIPLFAGDLTATAGGTA